MAKKRVTESKETELKRVKAEMAQMQAMMKRLMAQETAAPEPKPINKAAPEVPRAKATEERKQRYGERIFSVGGHRFVMDYGPDRLQISFKDGDKVVPLLRTTNEGPAKGKNLARKLSRAITRLDELKEHGELLSDISFTPKDS